MERLVEFLRENDDVTLKCLHELDSYMGFLGDNRLYEMYELDDLHCGISLHDFLERLTSNFNINDEFFYYSIYGLESYSGDELEFYLDYVTYDEIADSVLEYAHDIDLALAWIDAELVDIIEELESTEED